MSDGPFGRAVGGIPESVSEIIRSMSASPENFLAAAAGFSADGVPVRTVARESSSPERVSCSRRSTSEPPPLATAVAAAPGAGPPPVEAPGVPREATPWLGAAPGPARR